jgi:hypothetical protein
MSQRSVANTSADPTVEFAELQIDGVTYRLSYDFNAIAEAEEIARRAGEPINLLEGIATVMFNSMNAAQLRGLLWAAMRKAHRAMTMTDKRKPGDVPVPTLAKVGALIGIDAMPDIRDALLRAWNASMPEGKKFLKDPPEGAAPPPAPES